MQRTWNLIGLLAAACMALPASGAAGKLDPMDIFNLELASGPQISPDGKRIVYVRRFADVMTDRTYSNLWIVNVDGSGHRPLTSGLYGDHSPQWSADGTQLVFISSRGGSTQLQRLWLDTLQVARLTNLTEPPEGLRWSPDGKWLSFTMFVPGKPRKLI